MRLKKICPLLLLLLVSCDDNDLQRVATNLRSAAATNLLLQDTVINSYALKLLTEDQARAFVVLTGRIGEAGKTAVAITRTLNTLETQDRTDLLAILAPIISALADQQVNSALNAVTDEKTRTQIRALIILIQTSLNSAQIILAAG